MWILRVSGKQPIFTTNELGVVAELDHIPDMTKIKEYPVLGAPELGIDGEVKVAAHARQGKDEFAVARWQLDCGMTNHCSMSNDEGGIGS